MTTDRTLLLIGGMDDVVTKAAGLGLRVLLIQHPDKITPLQRRLAHAVRVVDYTDWAQVEPVARELGERPGFSVALSLTEPGMESAGRVNDLFGLDGTGYEVTRRFRDKLAMRRHLAGTDLVPVPAEPLTAPGDLASFGARHGYPFVVKPSDATASIAVMKVEGPGDAERVWRDVERLRGTRTDRVSALFVLRDFLMEAYVEGPEFSVEALSFAGRHVVVAITEKFVGGSSFAELGHALPARLPEPVQERIRAAVARFLTVMGLRDGLSHTELRLGPGGPVVIEGHNRGAGDAIQELVAGAYGIDLTSYALGWPFGLVEPLPPRPLPHAGAAVRGIVGSPGRVESIAGVEQARALPDVLDVRITAAPGDAVRDLRDNWDRLGLVAVTGADTSAAVARAADVIRDVVDIRILGTDGRVHRARPAGLEAEVAV